MITMRNFRVLVPTKDEALLGYSGENLSRRFEITVDDPGAWAYKLDVRNEAGVANIIDLLVDGNVLYTEIERAALQVSGKVTAQIRAIDGDKVKCSNTFWLFIGDSVEAVAYFESLPPSEFEQMEARMTAIRDEVEQMAADLKDVSADVEAAQTAARTATEAAGRAEAAKAAAETAQAAAEKAAEEASSAAGGGVTSFNGRGGAVTSQKGDYSADDITFEDGETFQQKYDSGELKGEPGNDGSPGNDGNDGTSVTVTSVSESTADGGSNVVTFSDGKTLTVKNGSRGSDGEDGKTPVKGTDYFTDADKAEMVAAVVDEMGDAMPLSGGTFTGKVYAGAAHQAAGEYLLRNSMLSATETDPTVNGQICWVYE